MEPLKKTISVNIPKLLFSESSPPEPLEHQITLSPINIDLKEMSVLSDSWHGMSDTDTKLGNATHVIHL